MMLLSSYWNFESSNYWKLKIRRNKNCENEQIRKRQRSEPVRIDWNLSNEFVRSFLTMCECFEIRKKRFEVNSTTRVR